MKKQVLVLDIKNDEINSLFEGLREGYSNAIPSSPHITIQGPRNKFKKSIIYKAKKIIRGISIKINDLDIIEYKNLYFCILKVNAPALEKVWDKPDFPKKIFGFNPHITLYKGDKVIAEEVKKLIKSKNKLEDLVITSKDIEVKKSIIG
ncbi:hypothetical protein [Cardiobacterium sp. Marseille-Q4385]|jgi:hypothetical protein|uniref:hypothetical protein n=1 Tax=Cardiobacterium sp. Marseille-Q4385 TaxID=2866573 RepID=UPI001CE422EE|nr:hypothetical protein [Cardiobacterium sp. Marseille-Q4385]